MYAAPPVAVVPAARRTGIASAPVLGISCLLFILFLIAVTIVLALIPIYLPRKGTGLARPRTYYLTLTYPGSIGPDGLLGAQARANLARALENKLNLPTGSVVVTRLGVITIPVGKRKRRERGLQRIRRGVLPSGATQVAGASISITATASVNLDGDSLTLTANINASSNNGPVTTTIQISITESVTVSQALNPGSSGSSSSSTTTVSSGSNGGATAGSATSTVISTTATSVNTTATIASATTTIANATTTIASTATTVTANPG